MGSSLMMSTLNSTRDMPLTDKEIDALHKLASSKPDDDNGRVAPLSASAQPAADSGRPATAANAGKGLGSVDDQQGGIEDISLLEMLLWSALNLWGVWLLTCVLTMWSLRDHLPIRESLLQYFLAAQVFTVEDQIFCAYVLALSFFTLMCLDLWCQRCYEISFFHYLRTGDLLVLKLPEKREKTNVLSDYKVWRNPLGLFRGAEYNRYSWATEASALTNWDRELTAQDQGVMFGCSTDEDDPDSPDAIMAMAWRSSSSQERLQLAHRALGKDPDHPAALLLLAEEEAATLVETEGLLRQAMKSLETSGQPINAGPVVVVGCSQTTAGRNKALLVYIKWRLGMCARKLGHLKDAVRLFRQVTRDCPFLSAHENLIEALLEMKNYADVQQVLSKYDDLGLPKSATICYTSVLLRARSAGELPLVSVDINRGGVTNAELELVSSISRAVEFNPHVPQYLLEQKSFVLPPEHVVKRGDSEAVAYAFHHLRHWKQIDSALVVLHYSWMTAIAHLQNPTLQGRYFHPYPTSTRDGDGQILPSHHSVSTHPFKHTPVSIKVNLLGCTLSFLIGLVLQTFPAPVKAGWLVMNHWFLIPLEMCSQLLEHYFPAIWLTLSEG